jgi:murein L,D-transpeptidase YcbB/YkuD
MPLVSRMSLAGLALVAATTSVAFAIEPDAPNGLITPQEAMIVAARLEIDQLPATKDKGEKADREGLAAYYAAGQATPIWIEDGKLNARAQSASAEIRKAGEWGLDPEAFALPDFTTSLDTPEAAIKAELAMSLAALKYARHARGGRMDPTELSLDIDRTPPLETPSVVLESLKTSADPAAYLRDQHPKHEQFLLLRTAYLKALEDERKAVEPAAEAGEKKQAKQRKPKSKSTRLSTRLLYNMEMWRWMPRELGEKFIWSNIPEFRVRVVKNGRVVHQERIVAGKIANKTPIFSDEMETIVFHPFWGVPNSIKVKEILPSLVRGGNILQRQNLRISYGGREVDPYSVDWSRQDIRNFHVFQPPGQGNALGVVKFMFPNKHAVYMHDTPSKHLFKQSVRAYSHGCMRVRDPLKLAEVVLSHDKGWDRARIDALVRSGPKNNQILLSNKIPVHVTYFTARIDEAGKPVLVKDIYEHEKRIQMGLEGKAHLIPKSKVDLNDARNQVVTNASGYNQRRGNDDWRRQILGN